MRYARKVYDVEEWTVIRYIQLCPKKPTAIAAGKPIFDCVPCNKSFPKIHFLFVLSICLPPRFLSSLSSLIPYPFDPGIWNTHDCDNGWAILATIYLYQIDNCPNLKSFSLHIASINHNRKAGLRMKNYKSIIVMMQINPYFLLKLSRV